MNRRTRHLYALTIKNYLPVVHEFSTKEERNKFLELHPDAKRLTSVEAAAHCCYKTPEKLKQILADFHLEIKQKIKEARKQKIKVVTVEVEICSCLAKMGEIFLVYSGDPKFLLSAVSQTKIKRSLIEILKAEKRSPDFYEIHCFFRTADEKKDYYVSTEIPSEIFIK